MRRIVVFNRVTLDGSFAAADGSLDWVVPDPELDRSVAATIERSEAGADTILFGRRTYQMFEAFWPRALDDAGMAADPHDDRGRSPEMRAMAVMLNAATKLVFSRTLGEVTWEHAALRRALDPGEIRGLKEQAGNDIMIFGSGSIVSQLTELGLIDEYQFVMTPLILGTGTPLFGGVSRDVPFDLLEATPFPSGNVLLRYAPR